MKIKILITLFALITFALNVMAAPLKADAKTKRIPAGTMFKLQLIDPVTTEFGNEGDYFSAMLIEDQKSSTGVILPAGSILRGSIDKIKPSKRLSRGAVLYLDFDHVVTPNGRQVPLNLGVTNRNKITYDGGLYEAKGYGEAITLNAKKTAEITKKATNYGLDVEPKPLAFVTVPVCAFGGAIGGGAYFLGDSVIDLFRKGANVNLQQGQIIDVVLSSPIDVPVQ
jgi:hypothetical protein